MPEYIEREAKCENCIHFAVCEPHTESNESFPEVGGCPVFKNKADVAEVVRCKGCRYWGGVTFGYICRRFSGTTLRNETRETDYCSFGEKMDGKGDAE